MKNMILATTKTYEIKATTLRVSFLYRIFLDIFILASVLALALNFSKFMPKPIAEGQNSNVRNGYFCWDPALSYPYTESSISPRMLYRIGQQAPLLIIFILELILFYNSLKKNQIHFLSGSSTITFLLLLYQPITCFLFGYASERLFKAVAKHFFPTLRPHFFDVCQPQPLNNDSCSENLHQNQYITKYSCSFGEEFSTDVTQGIYGSFPSGHASLACYGMIFIALYLQQRFVWRRSQLLKHVLQLVCLLVAWYVSVSRIRDHMQHPGAVMAGALLGASIAVCAAHFVAGGCSPQNALQEAKEKPVHAERSNSGVDSTELQWVLGGYRRDTLKEVELPHLNEIHLHTRL